MASASHFQVKLSGEWKDYQGDEDKILKRAYLAGFPNAKYKLRGQTYEINFKSGVQKNARSGKERNIRPPHKWKPPASPIVPSGPTTCIKVPAGAAGSTIEVPHPKLPGEVFTVQVPTTAKDGQAMLVPVPGAPSAPAAAADAPAPAAEETTSAKSGGWTTGAKVAAGAGVVGVAGVAVAGALLGEHIAEEGWDAAMADLGDMTGDAGDAIGGAAEDAGEAIAGAAEDAVDWVGDAGDAVGAFVMDLF